MKTGDIVRFHSPMADEDPLQTYVLLDDPEATEKHAEQIRTGFGGKYPAMPKYRAQVKIQVLGSRLPFPPINTVALEDLCGC